MAYRKWASLSSKPTRKLPQMKINVQYRILFNTQWYSLKVKNEMLISLASADDAPSTFVNLILKSTEDE